MVAELPSPVSIQTGPQTDRALGRGITAVLIIGGIALILILVLPLNTLASPWNFFIIDTFWNGIIVDFLLGGIVWFVNATAMGIIEFVNATLTPLRNLITEGINLVTDGFFGILDGIGAALVGIINAFLLALPGSFGPINSLPLIVNPFHIDLSDRLFEVVGIVPFDAHEALLLGHWLPSRMSILDFIIEQVF